MYFSPLSVDCRPIGRPTYRSTDCRPTVDRQSVDLSADRRPTTYRQSTDSRSTYRPTVDRQLSDCRSPVGRQSVNVSTDCRSTRSQLTVGRQSTDCRRVGFRQKSFSTISRMKQGLVFLVELAQTPDSTVFGSKPVLTSH